MVLHVLAFTVAVRVRMRQNVMPASAIRSVTFHPVRPGAFIRVSVRHVVLAVLTGRALTAHVLACAAGVTFVQVLHLLK